MARKALRVAEHLLAARVVAYIAFVLVLGFEMLSLRVK